MSTRGAWGFVIDGEVKMTYNHSDSYPSGLGADILRHLRDRLGADHPADEWRGMDELSDDARNIELIDESVPPTEEQKAKARKAGTIDLMVSEQSEDDWYCLTRGAQGDAGRTIELGLMPDGIGFVEDALFCEWAYVIDLDAGTFEVYRGLDGSNERKGRFAQKEINAADTHDYPPFFEGDDRDTNTCIRCNLHKDVQPPGEICSGKHYPYPVSLVASFPLDDLPANLDEIERAIYGSDDEED